MKTANCTLCRHWRFGVTAQRKPRLGVFMVDAWNWWACLRGHRPRFFNPLCDGNRFGGWKRRCADFVDALERLRR